METETPESLMARDFESMFTPAELHPDLAAYLVKGPPFDMLQHPLVYSVPYHEVMNNHHNQRYEMLKADVAQALKTKNAFRYIFQHERPYRLNALCDYLDRQSIRPGYYWEALGAVWADSENIWQNLEIWKRLLRSKRSQKFRFMDETERKALKELPDELTVYRGCVRGLNEECLSWTLDKDKAARFSKRWRRNSETPIVLTKTVSRKQVFAYLLGRGENEVILL